MYWARLQRHNRIRGQRLRNNLVEEEVLKNHRTDRDAGEREDKIKRAQVIAQQPVQTPVDMWLKQIDTSLGP